MAHLRPLASPFLISSLALLGCHPADEPVSEVAQGITVTQQGKLLASDAVADDSLGSSVAVDGDVAIVGAYRHVRPQTGRGAAYVYRRTGTTWAQEAELGPPSPAFDSSFGIAVAVSGDTAVVGAYGDFVGVQSSGTAYVFVRTNGTWQPQARLVPTSPLSGDAFGSAVAIEGDTAVIGSMWKNGATGAAYVFVREGTAWSLQATLVAPNGQPGDEFGHEVAISGDTIVAGADRASPVAPQSGAAHVFRRTGTAWAHEAGLSAPDGAAVDFFGYTVSVSSTTTIVGAMNNGEKGVSAGAAYVFERGAGGWVQQAKLLAAAGKQSDNFGRSVSLKKDTALIGAPFVNGAGAAYLFTRTGGTWTEALSFAPADVAFSDRLAENVALSGSTALLGASWNDGAATDAGAAYVFAIDGLLGSACSSGAQCASGFCAGGVCCDAACTGGCATCAKAGGAVADGTCTPLGGIACDDGNGCTANDVCTAGVCGGTPFVCPAADDCHEAGVCSGGPPCTYAEKPDGTACLGGTCAAGACVPTTTTTTTSTSMGGAGGTGSGGSGGAGGGSGGSAGATATSTGGGGGGGGGVSQEPRAEGGCGCRAAGGALPGEAGVVAAVAALGLAARRRRGRGARS